jgi:iron complex transport system substrate-binding protein
MNGERALANITGEIVDATVKLHIAIGPGLLESIYEVVLARDLQRRGFRVERQKSVSFEYDGLQSSDGKDGIKRIANGFERSPPSHV